ncbi:polyketide cyclase / dehydrase and lipid transport [Pseudonocardiaceae bacterium YIM PH 21723]|nr:polyketide cyclase / dehydrase and lipid transport [Pseudonocardiaceae bacterium YIM PH 21723]
MADARVRDTLEHVTSIHVVDQTFIAAQRELVAPFFHDQDSWRRYWPDLVLVPYQVRGKQGIRWTVYGDLIGTMEIWLEPVMDGTVVHYFLKADKAARDSRDTIDGAQTLALTHQEIHREWERWKRAAKAVVFEVKAEFDRERAPGVPPA